MKKNTLIILGSIVLAVILILIAVNQSKKNTGIVESQSTTTTLQGEQISLLDPIHIQNGSKADYNSNPPTSGSHYGTPANWGVYREPIPDEAVIHNLEHGGIWISYQQSIVGEQTQQQIETIARKYPQAVIVSPRQENDSLIALASWGRLQKLDAFDEQEIDTFIKSNINNSPEKFAVIGSSVEEEKVKLEVGDIFPDFNLTDVGERTFTRDSFKGKPSIIWFTTEFCVPCQIGAKEVAKLDSELGGNAFDVFVVFVDPRETKEDLISWKNRFANDDWVVSFDNFNEEQNSLSAKINLKFLDTKYLLDSNGVIQNVDLQIANEKYLGLIREVVGNI